MRNKLIDLNNHLFAQIERIADDDLMKESGEAEIKRANALKAISAQVIKLHVVALQAEKLKQSGAIDSNELSETFELKKLN